MEKHGGEAAARGHEVAGEKVAGGGLAEDLGEDLEVGDPEGTVGGEGGDDPGPGGFKPLGGRDMGGHRGPEHALEFLVPFAEGQEESFGEQGVLGREVIADGGEADAGGGGDVAGGGAGVALFEQTLFGCQEEGVAIAHEESLGDEREQMFQTLVWYKCVRQMYKSMRREHFYEEQAGSDFGSEHCRTGAGVLAAPLWI